MTTEELLEELFRRGQLIRDHWWSAYRANLDRLGAELRSNEAFSADYGHLVTQLPDAPEMPFGSESMGLGASGVAHGIPRTTTPPPIPGFAEDDRDARYRRWEEAVGRRAPTRPPEEGL